MGWKSLLTIITDPKSATTSLDGAVDFARNQDAHLDILCLGIDRTQVAYYYAGATAVIQHETYVQAGEDATAIESAVRARMAREDIRWAVEACVAQVGGLAGIVGLRARYCDLVIQPRPYGPDRSIEDEASVEAALFEGQSPVLILPPGKSGAGNARRIVVAWNQSDESMHAVRAALPLLKAADHVSIAVVDPRSHGPERSDPGGPLSQYLARHGAKTEVSVLARTMPRVSDVICRHARDINADLIVMGAYGHSRFREAILGGATRHMLEMAETPVFMAH